MAALPTTITATGPVRQVGVSWVGVPLLAMLDCLELLLGRRDDSNVDNNIDDDNDGIGNTAAEFSLWLPSTAAPLSLVVGGGRWAEDARDALCALVAAGGDDA